MSETKPKSFVESVEGIFTGLVAVAVYFGGMIIMFGGFAVVMLFWYGVAVLVFKFAFGVQLPNPFNLVPPQWRFW